MRPRKRERQYVFLDHRMHAEEAADYLGLAPATLANMRSKGGGPVFHKVGARVVYHKSDLDAWLAACRRTSTSTPATDSAANSPGHS